MIRFRWDNFKPKTMKIWIKYTVAFGLGLMLFLSLISMANNPETKIEGQWEELSWKYEKADWDHINKFGNENLSDKIKNMVSQNLVIHKTEKWKFLPDGKLLLEGKGYSKIISWAIKGRGNILELKYGNNVEHYSLSELSADKLILNFNTDAQTRGIARLTFKKIQ